MSPAQDLERAYDQHAGSLFALLLNMTRNQSDARDLLQEAVDRLPAYAAAAVQLAQLDALDGRRDAALARLRPIAEQSDDPDYAAQLARILGEA